VKVNFSDQYFQTYDISSSMTKSNENRRDKDRYISNRDYSRDGDRDKHRHHESNRYNESSHRNNNERSPRDHNPTSERKKNFFHHTNHITKDMPSFGRRNTNDPILMWDVENKLNYNVYYAGDGRPADSNLHPRNCCLLPERPSKRSHEQIEH
jgi:hypothetical protein